MTRLSSPARPWTRLSDATRSTSEMAEFARNLRMRMLVGRALQEDRVRLVFQPVVSAKAPERTAFWEALVRIIDRDGDVLPPAAFLPAIAGGSLAVALDCQVLRLALDQLADRPDLRVSVNVGPDSFAHPEWLAVLDAALERDASLGYRLIVEVTEDIDISGTEGGAAFVERLQAAGIAIALDDFGGGATSIRQLRAIRFDILKLDGAFCRALHCDADAVALTEAMVGIARHFDLMTVAEHIDDPQAAAKARALGLDCLQGFLFGEPAAAIPGRDSPVLRRTAI